MARLWYESKPLGGDKPGIVVRANEIIEAYAEQDLKLTTRQLYYRFVAGDLIPNTLQSYKRFAGVISDARMAGMIDWDAIEDRTRYLRELQTWESEADRVKSAARSHRIDMWENQPYYCEVWIEKDALVGVIEEPCQTLDVPFLSCRGYTSMSEMWGASQRLLKRVKDGKKVRIFHLGDHDPSGIDMTRDITDRLFRFLLVDLVRHRLGDDDAKEAITEAADLLNGGAFEVDRIALNMDQVEQYDPPPNPAKVTDSRARGYIARFGRESWELDALEPDVLQALVRDSVEPLLDNDVWNEDVERARVERARILEAADRWDEVAGFLEESA
jgi:hypothetical protein